LCCIYRVIFSIPGLVRNVWYRHINLRFLHYQYKEPCSFSITVVTSLVYHYCPSNRRTRCTSCPLSHSPKKGKQVRMVDLYHHSHLLL
jgi:hypothetical protein